MKLREVTKQDKEKIMEMYEEYMLSELIPWFDTHSWTLKKL